ncbi:glycoside hydrolase family 19 protein [Streptomyces niveiscabiei]|uniref:Glycoside hydrolase family 19 protein n=1 Tax=Streptomyces niveiscabiei TaxID=164115 RepID=A0ABW9I3Y4_9ACTN
MRKRIATFAVAALALGGSVLPAQARTSDSTTRAVSSLLSADPACPSAGSFTYQAFVTAANTFPLFAAVGDTATRQREIAAFLANAGHETSGGWPTAPDGPYAWGLCFKEEPSPPIDYCDTSQLLFPCAPGLVSSDPVVGWKTALWFWMNKVNQYGQGKVTSHGAMTGPTGQGFGQTIEIFNGGIECGVPTPPAAADRIGYFKRIADILGVSYLRKPGDRLDCENSQPAA